MWGHTPADVLKEMYKVSKLTGGTSGIKNKNGKFYYITSIQVKFT